MSFSFFLRHSNREKSKELTDARAFPISSPELPAVVPRLAVGTKRVISQVTREVNITGMLRFQFLRHPTHDAVSVDGGCVIVSGGG